MLPGLIVAGILVGFIGPPIERLLRTVYNRDESFQLLLTFALVLMFQDVFRFIWGSNPRSLDSTYLIYGTITGRDFSVPVYNLLVIAAAIATAAGLGAFLQRTNYGRVLRATAENRAMAEALGVDVRRVYAVVFTVGAALGTTAGALVVPTAAASLDMAIEFVVEAFAVVVIGGLGSMRGALAGALIVGLIRAYSLVHLSRGRKCSRSTSSSSRFCCCARPACSGDRWHEARPRRPRGDCRHRRRSRCCRWWRRPITRA